MSTSPAIIIFGAGLRPDGTPSPTLARRIEAALAFGRSRPGAIYLPTGGIGRHGPSEAQAMAGALQAAGIAAGAIILEETARDTLESVIACRAILRERHHIGPVYAASSAYHLPRCLLLLRFAGIRAGRVPPLPGARPGLGPGSGASGWRKRWYWRLREIPALPWDALLILLRR